MLINWVAVSRFSKQRNVKQEQESARKGPQERDFRCPILPVKSVFRTARTVVNLSLTYLPIEIYTSTSTTPKIKLIQIGLSKSYREMHPYL